MNDINKEAINKWIEALRSGEYKQGYYRLRTYSKKEDTFCCLGVACDVLKDELDGEWVQKADDYTFEVSDDQFHGQEYMPDVVVEYIGLPERFLNDDLSELNDRENYSFRQIANKLENKLEEYD